MQESQKGVIGITLLAHWFVPYSHNKLDQDAAERAMEFMFGWLVLSFFFVTLKSGKFL